MTTCRTGDHFPLGRLPLFAAGAAHDATELGKRWQLPVLRAGIPDRGALLQQQLGPAGRGLFLFACQPVTQRRHQVVMGQLIMLQWRVRRRFTGNLRLRGRRRDQSQLTIQDPHQLVELPRFSRVAAGRPQLLQTTHVPLDFDSRGRQQRPQHAPRRQLVTAMFRRSRAARKRPLQK